MAGVPMASISSSGLIPDHEHRRDDGVADVLSFADAQTRGADAARPVPSDDRIDFEEAVPVVSRRMSDRPSDKRVEWVRAAVARYERPLTQYAAHLLGGDVDRARDLVQEAFLRLCDQEQEKLESHLGEWLYTVCRNLAIDSRRKDRRMRLMSEEQEATFPAEHESPTDAAERLDVYSRVTEALADLPPRQQEIVRLKFQHGLSYKEIGEVMNLSATNVGFILHTAIKGLRQKLK
jgi:RNA polymerase sigma-70 factor (ECF subfamily)